MALKIVCDGCGTALENDEVSVRGIVVTRQYCEKCAATIDVYMAAVDEAHTAVAKQWETKTKKLTADFTKKNPNFVLPDA